MNRLYFTKRAKVVIGLSTIVFVGVTGFGLTTNLSNFSYFANQNIIYSTSSPSTIEKNPVNDKNFTSPVTNVKFVPKPPEKVETIKKVEAPKTDQSNIIPPKPKQSSKAPDTQISISTPKVEAKPVKNPTPSRSEDSKNQAPAPAVTPLSVDQILPNDDKLLKELQNRLNASFSVPSNYSDVEKEALLNYELGLKARIKRTLQDYLNLKQQYLENERSRRENFDTPYNFYAKGNRSLWEEAHDHKRFELIGVSYNNDLQRYQRELDLYAKQPEKTSFTPDELTAISRGMTFSPEDNLVMKYRNPDDNPVTGKNGTYRIRNRKRFFNTPGWVPLNPEEISSGNFPGWTKTDISSTGNYKSQGVDGQYIKVYKYVPNDKYEPVDGKTKGEQHLIELDANDKNSFAKFQEVLKKVAASDSKLTAVRIKNIGEIHSTQNASNILSHMPNSIKAAYVFLNNYYAVDSLDGLRGKKLDELAIYTEKNSLNADWAINPNDIENVKYISFDYFNQGELDRNAGKAGSSIVFNTLRWTSKDDRTSIAKGLKIAYDDKLTERIFQGNLGGKGGYPTILDFSATKQNTFTGLDLNKVNELFNDKIKNWPGDKYAQEDYQHRNLRFTKLIIGSHQGKLTFNAQDLNDAGWNWFVAKSQFEQPKIEIKEGDQITPSPTVEVTGQLNSQGVQNLIEFIHIANSNTSGMNITLVNVGSQNIGLFNNKININTPGTDKITKISADALSPSTGSGSSNDGGYI
ncbi:putative immunoglobulin-blocking virulence protein [Mesomycoplasma bovoculi]|uniref:Immunoglobulin-blocking virulence protein n=1 Tax=Mesomycoplasma bovoculi M165/69 TaxID=743966 RepID=W5V0T1_9BACT|nr:putative immunoglobulin-blocking virulence protein [Mesomycoplasma bovoculi]AHH45378.1 hypothetical protein MYB_01850 [Mesomycoplasma bovoculi M165/69]